MKEIIRAGLAELGLLDQVPPEAPEQLAEYGRLMLEKKPGDEPDRHHRPGAGGPPPHAGQRPIRISIRLSGWKDPHRRGHRAGLPGLPLKILVPSLQVTLLDSLGKRVDWLNQVCAQLGWRASRPSTPGRRSRPW